MKKVFIPLIVIALMIVSTFGLNVVLADEPDTGAASEGLNLRSEPSTSADIIYKVDRGSIMNIISEDGDWYQVEINGFQGYVYKEYVDVRTWREDTVTDANSEESIEEEIDEEQPEVQDEEAEDAIEDTEDINTDWTSLELSSVLNVKVSPSFSSRSQSSISEGSTITVLDEINSWVKVTDGNVTGWAVKGNIN